MKKRKTLGLTLRNKEFIDTLIKMSKRKKFNENDFINEFSKYVSLKKKTMKEDDLRFGTDYGLLIKEKNYYVFSDEAFYDLLINENKEQIKFYLHNIYYDKEDLYKKLIDTLNERQFSKNKLKNIIGTSKQTVEVLLKWGEWFDKIQQNEITKEYYIIKIKGKIDLVFFWNKLLEHYSILDKIESMPLSRSYYVKIPLLKNILCAKEKISFKTFNELMDELLSSPNYGNKINIMSAPETYIEYEKRKGLSPFKYKGRFYYFIYIQS